MDTKYALTLLIQICVYVLYSTVSVAGTQVRLVNGRSHYGTVKVYYNGTWGTVCDDHFDDNEAIVICRMLGFHGNVKAYSRAHFGNGYGPILMDNLQCTGRESDIADCPSDGWYDHDCGHSEDAGVDCSAVRLVNGADDYGTVEVYYKGTWGTICDDSFDDNEAAVICRILGKHGKVRAYTNAFFGQGSGPILMDEVRCMGNEKSIGHCPSNGWSNHDCTHSEDAGVNCNDLQAKSEQAASCFDTDTCPCCDATCPSDGSGQCRGNCRDGYHGYECWNKCPSNCIRCVDAKGRSSVAFCTQCEDGYYSTNSLYQCQLSCPNECKACESSTKCTACIDTTYFLSANYQCLKCSESCLTCNSATMCTSCREGDYLSESYQCNKCLEGCKTCKSMSLCTSCESGYFLKGDEEKCYKCSPLCKSCTTYDTCICTNGCSEDRCKDSYGVCSFGCKPHFSDNGFNKCGSCKDNKYGYKCDLNCSSYCTESTCDRVSGACITCTQGYYGDHCDRNCPINCFSSCNKTTGNCDACKEGYHGDKCTLQCPANCKECIIVDGSCDKCMDGHYGTNCDKNCSEHCLIDQCQKTNGSCVCAPGFEGEKCQLEVKTTTTISFNKQPYIVVTQTPGINVGATVGITLGCIVVIACTVAAVIFIYRRKQTNGGANNRPSIFSVTTDRATVVAQKCRNPYQNTGRADIETNENSYEMLQRQPQQVPPYTPMQF